MFQLQSHHFSFKVEDLNLKVNLLFNQAKPVGHSAENMETEITHYVFTYVATHVFFSFFLKYSLALPPSHGRKLVHYDEQLRVDNCFVLTTTKKHLSVVNFAFETRSFLWRNSHKKVYNTHLRTLPIV